MKKILFLCTGNYYRSRFAEEIFNHLAKGYGIEWRAVSRGLAENITELRNPGPVSKDVLVGLQKRGIRGTNVDAFPKGLEEREIGGFSRIVVLCRREHEPLIERRFPKISSLVEYWDIRDTDKEDPQAALSRIEKRVEELMSQLK